MIEFIVTQMLESAGIPHTQGNYVNVDELSAMLMCLLRLFSTGDFKMYQYKSGLMFAQYILRFILYIIIYISEKYVLILFVTHHNIINQSFFRCLRVGAYQRSMRLHIKVCLRRYSDTKLYYFMVVRGLKKNPTEPRRVYPIHISS